MSVQGIGTRPKDPCITIPLLHVTTTLNKADGVVYVGPRISAGHDECVYR